MDDSKTESTPKRTNQSEEVDALKNNVLSQCKYVDMDFMFNALSHRFIVIDIRSFDDYSANHIHTALHLSVSIDSKQSISNPNALSSNGFASLIILYGDNTKNQESIESIIDFLDEQITGFDQSPKVEMGSVFLRDFPEHWIRYHIEIKESESTGETHLCRQ